MMMPRELPTLFLVGHVAGYLQAQPMAHMYCSVNLGQIPHLRRSEGFWMATRLCSIYCGWCKIKLLPAC